MIQQATKKTATVNFVLYDGSKESQNEIIQFTRGLAFVSEQKQDPTCDIYLTPDMCIGTLAGGMICGVGDYVVEWTSGRFYPCKPDVFAVTYKKALSDSESTTAIQKKVVYQTQWVARDKSKEYPHGWGFTAPLAEFPQDMDVAECVRHCREMSGEEFECIGATPVPLVVAFAGDTAPDRSEYDKCTSTKHNSVCLARAGDDEPIFVLRAKDATAPEIVAEWAIRNRGKQPPEKIDGAFALATEMGEWRAKNVTD